MSKRALEGEQQASQPRESSGRLGLVVLARNTFLDLLRVAPSLQWCRFQQRHENHSNNHRK